MPGKKQATEEILDIEAMEKSFNDTLTDLRKAVGEVVEETESNSDDGKTLKKAAASKAAKAKGFDEGEEEEEEAEEEEEEEEEEEKVGKSIEDQLSEDPEAEASMDVEPFLRQLAKAIDDRINEMHKSIGKKLEGIEILSKAQGKTLIAQSELSKAQADAVKKIAQEDRKIGGLRRLNKARFEGGNGGDPVEVNGPVVLEKSLDWLKENKIDLLEAGMIEARVNKGVLGRQDDRLDHKVARLLKEAS